MEIVNIETLNNLREFMSPDEVSDLLQKVLVEINRSSALLGVHFEAKDWPALRAVAHRLKGSLGSVGCDAIYSGLDKLELNLMSQPIAEPTQFQFRELMSLLDTTHRTLSDLIGASSN